MSQSSVIQVRVDSQLKEDAETLFTDLGLDIPSAIRLFLKQAIARNGIPFPVKRGDDFFNPHNVNHLKKALKALDAGEGVMHKLIEANG
jgi:DNA-damage-inducible protein J